MVLNQMTEAFIRAAVRRKAASHPVAQQIAGVAGNIKVATRTKGFAYPEDLEMDRRDNQRVLNSYARMAA